MKNNFVADSPIIAQDRRLQEANITIHAGSFPVSQKSQVHNLIPHCFPLLVQRAERRYQNRVPVLKAYADTC